MIQSVCFPQHCVPMTHQFFFSSSLFLGATICSELILYISCSSPWIYHFSKQPWFLSWRIVLETRICALGMLTAVGMALLLGPLSWKSKEIYVGILICVYVKVAQSRPTLCSPMDYTVHGVLQARILKWVAIPYSRGSSQPRDGTQVSHIAGRFFYQLSHKGSPRILEWVAYAFCRGSSWPRNQTGVSCTAGTFFTNWAVREALSVYIYMPIKFSVCNYLCVLS